MEFDGLRLDGVLWIYERGWQPLCPKHHLRLELKYNSSRASRFECAEGEDYELPREHTAQKRYVQNKIDANELKKRKYVNIDGEYTPIAEGEAKSKDGRFFVHAVLTDSKVGQRLVVYAGEKGKEKSQIFVEPDIKRLAFDQTNTHPVEVFVKLEATFDDGSKAAIERG
jgi:hypothetical protein